MSYYYSNTSSLRSAAPLTVDDLSSHLSHGLYIHEKARIETAVQITEHGGAYWSALKRLNVKTGLRAVRSAAGPHPRSAVPIPSDLPEAVFSTLSTNTLDEPVTTLDPNAPLTDYDVPGSQYPQTPSRSQF